MKSSARLHPQKKSNYLPLALMALLLNPRFWLWAAAGGRFFFSPLSSVRDDLPLYDLLRAKGS